MVDTAHDTCLLSGPHLSPQSGDISAYMKDLYVHRDKSNKTQYYFRIHPAGTIGKDKIVPVSPVMAERHLLSNGITCDDFPASEPVFRLYNWGYGIIEEF